MNQTMHDEKEQRCRLEDSFSLPENQRKNPDDPYAFEHEKEVMAKWHRRNEMEKGGKK